VPFRVDRSTIGRYLGADRRTYHLVTSHLAVDAETSFARRPRHANHGLPERYQPTVYTTICGEQIKFQPWRFKRLCFVRI
jgi:hypothetical protein